MGELSGKNIVTLGRNSTHPLFDRSTFRGAYSIGSYASLFCLFFQGANWKVRQRARIFVF